MKVGNAGKYETSEGSCHQISEGNKDSRTKMGIIFVIPLLRICLQFVLRILVFTLKMMGLFGKVNLSIEGYSGWC